MSEYFATHIIQVGVPQIKTLDDIGVLSTSSTKLTLSKAVRPGTFDHTSSPPVSSIIESTVDGILYWIDSGGTPAALGTASGSWQPLDSELTALASLTSSANTAPYFTGSGGAALMTVTPAARTLLDDADVASMRTTLGVVIGTNVQAYDADLTSLAAATGTNTIYYRSASDTWSAVTVGSGLTFTGGTLDAAGGAATWGAIVGTLADQTDLQAELDALQPLDAELTAFAGLTSASDTAPYFTGSGTAALMTVTGAARDLLDDADAAAMRTTLGVVIGTNVQAYDAGLSALGALSTTDKIYYLSAADTWTAVTIGSGLTFSTGTLSASGGGSGDMVAATYDPATIAEQVVGLTATQTLTNKTLTAPTLTAPVLGTPASGDLTNCTFPTLNQSTTGNAATVTTNANLTGHITSTGNAAVLGSFTVAQLNTALSDGDVATGGGTATGTNTGDQTSVSGNAGTATALATARNINGVAFDGTANITVTAAGSTLSDTVTVANGGTGLTALGTALQVLRTNAGATAMEWSTLAGGGDVSGPSSSVDAEVALFDSTTGKLLKRASGTGIATLTSGVLSTVTAPSGTIVGTTDTQTLTNKTLTAPIVATISNTGTLTLPTSTDTLVGRATTDTLTNKRVTKRVGTEASNATITINSDAYDDYTVTALATNATIAAPTGTPTNRQRLVIQIKDNGAARTLSWNAAFRVVGATLPTTTVISKLTVVGCIWDSGDSKWNVMVVAQEA